MFPKYCYFSADAVYFHFKDCPHDVFDKVLAIKVLNAKVVLKDASLGPQTYSVLYSVPGGPFAHHISKWQAIW